MDRWAGRPGKAWPQARLLGGGPARGAGFFSPIPQQLSLG